MRNKIAYLIIYFLVFSGCTLYRINSEETTLDYYPSKKTIEEVIYVEDITEPHEIIGHITVNAERRQTVDNVIQKMKREAAILGGDGITNLQSDASGTWKRLPAQQAIGNAYIRANFSANVIIFK